MTENYKIIKNSKVIDVVAENESAWIDLEKDRRIYAGYWRLNSKVEMVVSSFENKQGYGMPNNIINAVEILKQKITNAAIVDLQIDEITNDLNLYFDNNYTLQIFSFTGNEDWEIEISEDISILSNYAKNYLK